MTEYYSALPFSHSIVPTIELFNKFTFKIKSTITSPNAYIEIHRSISSRDHAGALSLFRFFE